MNRRLLPQSLIMIPRIDGCALCKVTPSVFRQDDEFAFWCTLVLLWRWFQLSLTVLQLAVMEMLSLRQERLADTLVLISRYYVVKLYLPILSSLGGLLRQSVSTEVADAGYNEIGWIRTF